MVCKSRRTPNTETHRHTISLAGCFPPGFMAGCAHTHCPHAEISKISHRGGKEILQAPMQAQFLSKKGERFDTCYNPRGWNAILISDVHALSSSFVSKKGSAAREVCLMRLFWTLLEFTAAPATPAALETITTSSGNQHSPWGCGGHVFLREAGVSAEEGLCCQPLCPERSSSPRGSPATTRRRAQTSHAGGFQGEGLSSEQTPCNPRNSPAKTYLSLQVSHSLLQLLDHGIFGLNHRFGVLEL